MSIMRWDPFGELANFRNQMNRFFDHTFRRGLLSGAEPFGPRVDLYQTEQEVVATAELPGIASKDDIEVSVTPDSLTLRGELKRVHDVKEENYFHSERYFGSFSRTLPLPAEVRPEETRASYQNGILEIRMPKSEKGRRAAHRIPVQ
ncbi:MAG: Hsp20/alpha crystallin family protein [Peptococcaceae bacterium]|nr:Hsp20/alpha crystallin family protein [Peptococcaceae bacterium]